MAAAKTRRRVALLGLFHETNTFSAIPASYDAFNTSRGAALLPPDGGQSVIAGYMAGVETDPEAELVPLMRASTGPIGIITVDAYSRLTAEMFGMLREQGPW
jgi:microcystin degradation protein MlrC